jgi:lipopolysaccharide export system protein LptC
LNTQRPSALFTTWLRNTLNQASTYLPLFLIGLLAMGTWWVVKNTPIFEPLRGQAAPRHEPDYIMEGFTVRRFDAQGTLSTVIQGHQARHYPDTDSLEIDQVRLRAIGAQGEVTTAQARASWSNHDGSELRLKGEALVIREATATEPAITFKGESLTALTKQQQISSEEPVTIERAGLRVDATSMTYDHASQTAQAHGRVQATFSQSATDKAK